MPFNFKTLWKSEMKFKSFINYKSTHTYYTITFVRHYMSSQVHIHMFKLKLKTWIEFAVWRTAFL